MAIIYKNEKGMHMRRANAKVQRNEPCPCGSGRKFKDCHLNTKKGKHGS